MCHLHIMHKKDNIRVIYIAELCTYIITNVSNSVSSEKNRIVLFKLTVHLVLSPVANFRANFRKDAGRHDKAYR